VALLVVWAVFGLLTIFGVVDPIILGVIIGATIGIIWAWVRWQIIMAPYRQYQSCKAIGQIAEQMLERKQRPPQ
jgi:hypothetical protein